MFINVRVCINVIDFGSVPTRTEVTGLAVMSSTPHDSAVCLRKFPLVSRSGASALPGFCMCFGAACVQACTSSFFKLLAVQFKRAVS